MHIFVFKAGIIEEMLEDTFESMEDGEEMEEAAEEEVDKILFEITAGEEICSARSSQYIVTFLCRYHLNLNHHKMNYTAN